jgi:hypothetical protein
LRLGINGNENKTLSKQKIKQATKKQTKESERK